MTLLTWLITVFVQASTLIGAAWALLKWLKEYRQTREIRTQDLRWRHAQAAKGLIDELLSDPPAAAALQMLDWDGRKYELPGGQTVTIHRSDYVEALRIDQSYTNKEVYIRDCFDNLFYFLALFEHWCQQKLIVLEDVKYPIEYYVPLLARDRATFSAFFTAYRVPKAEAFLSRFPDWGRAG